MHGIFTKTDKELEALHNKALAMGSLKKVDRIFDEMVRRFKEQAA